MIGQIFVYTLDRKVALERMVSCYDIYKLLMIFDCPNAQGLAQSRSWE